VKRTPQLYFTVVAIVLLLATACRKEVYHISKKIEPNLKGNVSLKIEKLAGKGGAGGCYYVIDDVEATLTGPDNSGFDSRFNQLSSTLYDLVERRYNTAQDASAAYSAWLSTAYNIAGGGAYTIQLPGPLFEPYREVCNGWDGGEGGGGSGSGIPGSGTTAFDITNHVQNPCLKKIVEGVINSDIRSATRESLLNVFKEGQNFNLEYYESNQLPDLTGGTATVRGGSYNDKGQLAKLNIEIKLNVNTLPDASEEYVALVVVHESIHAYLYSKGFFSKNIDQHDLMWSNYIDVMAGYLNQKYGTDMNEARTLATEGLQHTFQSKIDDTIYRALGEKLLTPAEQRATIAEKYRTGQKGTTCK